MNTVDTAFGHGSKVTRLRTALLVVAGIALLVAGVLAVNALTGDDEKSGGKLEGSSRDSYTLSYPDGWRPLSTKRLAALPGNPLAVLRRKGGEGYVILRREKRAPRSFAQFSGDLTRALKQRVPDFQVQSSRIVKINAGNAFFYSYIRRQRGTVHSVLVVPAGDRSYALNTVSQGGAEKAARETAQIILSFDL